MSRDPQDSPLRKAQYFPPGAKPTATVLIDTLSLYHECKRRFGGKIDYAVLLDAIYERFDVEACIAYVLDARDSTAFVKMLHARGVDDVELHAEASYGVALAVTAMDCHSSVVVVATANDFFDPLFRALGEECVVYSPCRWASGQSLITSDFII